MKKLVLLSILYILVGCDNQTKKESAIADKHLVYFDNKSPQNHIEHEKFKSLAKDSTNISVQYVEEYIIVSTYILANECLITLGDIKFKKDSIFLFSEDLIDENNPPCDGLEVKKLSYIIKNSNKKKIYKFKYEGVNLYNSEFFK